MVNCIARKFWVETLFLQDSRGRGGVRGSAAQRISTGASACVRVHVTLHVSARGFLRKRCRSPGNWCILLAMPTDMEPALTPLQFQGRWGVRGGATEWLLWFNSFCMVKRHENCSNAEMFTFFVCPSHIFICPCRRVNLFGLSLNLFCLSLQIFEDAGVSAVVRLNEPCYDKMEFERGGFNHYDIYFDDCSTPEYPPSPTRFPLPLLYHSRAVRE